MPLSIFVILEPRKGREKKKEVSGQFLDTIKIYTYILVIFEENNFVGIMTRNFIDSSVSRIPCVLRLYLEFLLVKKLIYEVEESE